MTTRLDVAWDHLSTAQENPTGVSSYELRAPYEKYLSILTHDVLGRAATVSAIHDGVEALCQGKSLRAAAHELLLSAENRQNLVCGFYQKFLRRVPNPEGLGLWTGLLASGKTPEEVLAAILSGGEYFKRVGGTHELFVRAVFREVLGRRPGDGEADAWIGLLNSQSASRLSLTYAFVTSDEYRVLLAKNWHLSYLRREPSAAALQKTVEQMKAGTSRDCCLADILSSGEYFTLTLGTL